MHLFEPMMGSSPKIGSLPTFGGTCAASEQDDLVAQPLPD
jgi:hypothetical protein